MYHLAYLVSKFPSNFSLHRWQTGENSQIAVWRGLTLLSVSRASRKTGISGYSFLFKTRIIQHRIKKLLFFTL